MTQNKECILTYCTVYNIKNNSVIFSDEDDSNSNSELFPVMRTVVTVANGDIRFLVFSAHAHWKKRRVNGDFLSTGSLVCVAHCKEDTQLEHITRFHNTLLLFKFMNKQ